MINNRIRASSPEGIIATAATFTVGETGLLASYVSGMNAILVAGESEAGVYIGSAILASLENCPCG